MADDLKKIQQSVPDFGKKEFTMVDFIQLIKKENEKKEKIKVWYDDIPYDGMFIPPGVVLNSQVEMTTLFHIVLRDTMDIVDQEFTMAHELAHYFLGHHEKDVFYGKMTGDKKEVKANLVCFIFKLPGKKREFGDLWDIVLQKEGDDYAYELINYLMDGIKTDIKELKRLKGMPLMRPVDMNTLERNIKEVKHRIDKITKITQLREIFISILDSYPKKKN